MVLNCDFMGYSLQNTNLVVSKSISYFVERGNGLFYTVLPFWLFLCAVLVFSGVFGIINKIYRFSERTLHNMKLGIVESEPVSETLRKRTNADKA